MSACGGERGARAKGAQHAADARAAVGLTKPRRCASRCRRLLARPPPPRSYLGFIGTAPAARGRGYASLLMRHITCRADAERRLCLLEATSDKSQRLYERHGFATYDTYRVAPAAPPVFFMRRDPLPAAPAAARGAAPAPLPPPPHALPRTRSLLGGAAPSGGAALQALQCPASRRAPLGAASPRTGAAPPPPPPPPDAGSDSSDDEGGLTTAAIVIVDGDSVHAGGK